MNPHQRMAGYDKQGVAYVVHFNFPNCPVVKNTRVLCHGPDWMEVQLPNQEQYPNPWFVNMDKLARIEIEVTA